MRGTMIPALLALAALAGCDRAPTIDPAPAPKVNDPLEAKIDALSEPLQRTTFFRAILDGGYTCQKVVRFAKQQPIEGRATWAAECEDHGQYVITLHNDGLFWVSGVPRPKRPG